MKLTFCKKALKFAHMKPIKTKDGSFTVKHDEINELYHSIHGAEQESEHVFIKHGAALHAEKKELTIFEMGFGTGLNTLMTYRYAIKNKVQVKYFAIETHPLSLEEAQQMNYTQTKDEKTFFDSIHTSAWDKQALINSWFTLHKIHAKIEDADLSFLSNRVDVVYFDAFAPTAQAHLWEPPVLTKMYKILKESGHLTTYCAKGQFKRDLKAVGFSVKAVAGPPGKREMTLALKES